MNDNDDRRATLLTILLVCCFCIDWIFKAVGLAFELLEKLWDLLAMIVAWINELFVWVGNCVSYLAHSPWLTAPWNWLATLPISSWAVWAQFVPLAVVYGLAEMACLRNLLRPLPRGAKVTHLSTALLTLLWFGLWFGARISDSQSIPLWIWAFPMLAALPLLAYSRPLEDGSRWTWTTFTWAFIVALLETTRDDLKEWLAERWKEKFGKDDAKDGIWASRPFGDDPRGRLYEVEKAGMLRKP